jgi:hypothetical protein
MVCAEGTRHRRRFGEGPKQKKNRRKPNQGKHNWQVLQVLLQENRNYFHAYVHRMLVLQSHLGMRVNVRWGHCHFQIVAICSSLTVPKIHIVQFNTINQCKRAVNMTIQLVVRYLSEALWSVRKLILSVYSATTNENATEDSNR